MTSRWHAPLAALSAIAGFALWGLAVSAPARRASIATGATGAAGARLAPGISAELAAARARTVDEVRYDLTLHVPADLAEPILGEATIRFTLREMPDSLVLDFAQPADHVRDVRLAGAPVPFSLTNGHLVIPASALTTGDHELSIVFVAGDDALNRRAEYLYSLFVPARAHLSIPCFDQPDIKARYTLTLSLPAGWEAVSNGAEVERRTEPDGLVVRFGETQPLSTYLFAFAAGRFTIDAADRAGRTLRMLHRETDTAKLQKNRDALFDLHASALAWMEEYTGIPYPFGKFDFVLVPSFQFSGMEHPGAILYNASSLLLDDTATQSQQLGRASTVAHETAHMWFGNLVTMRWFDDVWMKEVFANFFAAKIVNPAFPELNHDLRFLLAHHPAAYEVDRTTGANPIRQRLENLREAGSLYGAIIYQKAPIVMRQLEALVGEAAFRSGLREYLRRHAFGNASWPDLVALLDARTPEDLTRWSRTWVEEPGRPTIRAEVDVEADRLVALRFTQSDPQRRGLQWTQRFEAVLADARGLRRVSVTLDAPEVSIPEAAGTRRPAPRFVLPNATGLGYGLFELDPVSRRAIVVGLPDIPDPLARGSAWVTLWDEMLNERVRPAVLLDLCLKALPLETEEINVQRILGYLSSTYWRYLTPGARQRTAPTVEAALMAGYHKARATSLKAAYFSTLRDVALTADTLDFLARVWRRQEAAPGLPLSESDETALALELAVRGRPDSAEILQQQLARIENPDRRERFVFLIPALSVDEAARDRFFESLADESNRRHEPWVLDAAGYLHHPLRAGHSTRYLRPSLDLLQQVQRTGDIFFPKRWLDATLGGHNSAEASAVVTRFLDERADYPPRLRQLIIQSADPLFRASRIISRR